MTQKIWYNPPREDIAPVTRAEIGETLEVGETDRGAGGFGSTGV